MKVIRLQSLRRNIRLNMLCMDDFTLMQSTLDISTSLFFIDSAKDKVHLFQSPAFRFLEEEDNKDAHGETEDAEHEKRPPANAVDGMGCDFRDDEVEKPLGGCSKADTIRAESSREDLNT